MLTSFGKLVRTYYIMHDTNNLSNLKVCSGKKVSQSKTEFWTETLNFGQNLIYYYY